MAKNTTKMCCYFVSQPCDKKCIAYQKDKGDDGVVVELCRRLTSTEFAAVRIADGLEHLGMAILGPEAIAKLGCNCTECTAERKKEKENVEKEKADSRMYR